MACMEFLCEGTPEHGVLLVAVSSPDYDTFLGEIVRREANSTEGSPPFPEKFRPHIDLEDGPTSAILLNGSTKAIVGLHAVWQFETGLGPEFPPFARYALAASPLASVRIAEQLESESIRVLEYNLPGIEAVHR